MIFKFVPKMWPARLHAQVEYFLQLSDAYTDIHQVLHLNGLGIICLKYVMRRADFCCNAK